jgi:hypothetical protein
MPNLMRTLRTAAVALAIAGVAFAVTARVVPTATLLASGSGQPGEFDVGTTLTTDLLASGSGQPGEFDVGSLTTTDLLASGSGQPGEFDVG